MAAADTMSKTGSAQDFCFCAARGEDSRVFRCRYTSYGFFDLANRLSQIRAAEGLKQVNSFRDRNLRLLGFLGH